MTVSPPDFGKVVKRRLREELMRRASAWLPDWHGDSDGKDALTALLDIAATISADVTQRLDRVPEKSFRGMLHWLGRRGRSGTAARMPVVFRMSPRAERLDVREPIQLQADAGGTPVIFETDAPVSLIPTTLAAVYAADPVHDAYYGPYPGLDSLVEPEPAPDQWRVLATPTPGSKQIQLDPPEGLQAGLLLKDEVGDKYRVEEVKGNLVTLSPGLGVGLASNDPAHAVQTLWRVKAFDPFDGHERNQQKHHLYLGGDDLLDVSAAAVFELFGDVPSSEDWTYSAKPDRPDGVDWAPLKQAMIRGRRFLLKPAGEIEKRETAGANLRWLRAALLKGEQQFARDIRLSVNCFSGLSEDELKQAFGEGSGAADETISFDTVGTVAVQDMEAVANTTPIVLGANFYPLGREPRLFDAFYLSCPEAFAKPDAYARVRFTIGESFAGPLSIATYERSGAAVVAGVTVDGRLRLARLEPPDPDQDNHALPGLTFFGPFDPPKTGGRSWPLIAAQKLGIASSHDGSVVFVSAVDGQECWTWAVFDGGKASLGVEPYHAVPIGERGPCSASMLARDRDGKVDLYVVARKGLARRGISDDTWQTIGCPAKAADPLVGVMPFETSAPAGAYNVADGLVAVDAAGQVFWTETPADGLDRGDGWQQLVLPPQTRAANGWPLAIWSDKQRTFFLSINRDKQTLVTSTTAGVEPGDAGRLPVYERAAIGGSFAFLRSDQSRAAAGQAGPRSPSVIFAVQSGTGRQKLVFWNPDVEGSPFEGDAYEAQVEQAPVWLNDRLLLPTQNASITEHSLPGLFQPIELEHFAIAMPTTGPVEVGNDIMLRARNGKFYPVTKVIEDVGFVIERGVLPDGVNAVAYRFEGPFQGRSDGDTFELDAGDTITAKGSLLRVRIGSGTIHVTVKSVRNGVAMLDKTIRTGDGTYHSAPKTPELRFQLRPLLSLALDHLLDFSSPDVRFWFGTAEPTIQSVARVIKPEAGAVQDLILEHRWDEAPNDRVVGRVITFQGQSTTHAPPATRNPDLSWEYWNGRGWWRLKLVREETNAFRNSGIVSFCVPGDLTESEVVGRRGHWIRARLVAGDYGQERFVLEKAAEQNGQAVADEHGVITRDPSAIRAPVIAAVEVKYELCCDSRPDRVLTFDNGGFIDQTSANAAPNAQIPVFTSFVAALGQAAAADAGAGSQPPCCADCADASNAHPAIQSTEVTAEQSKNTSSTDAGLERAIYLGFSSPLKSAFNLMFLVDETPYDGVKPLRVDVLTGRAFKPVEVKDGTRGLSETGLVSLVCNDDLQPVTLFGQALHWLRLRAPEDVADGGWQPRLKGVFINATFAHAWASRSNEIVGFSDGSQGQTFKLAHAPVLDDTLELFVREPIGEEEIAMLNAEIPDTVRDKVDLWEGPWVHWHHGDVALAGPNDRVYDLDAAQGVISFGDGRQGRVPPIGTDNVLAVRYRTVDTGAAANAVGPWDALNMITPLRGVDAAITPEGAAGGSGTQDVETTMRFASANIAMRDRAVTLQDFERQALQSSPRIAQARGYMTRGGVEIVIVMRGDDPFPSSAVRRELVERLRGIGAPALRRHGAIVVSGPRPAPVEIDVELTITDLATAGGIVDAAQRAVSDLLDPGTGGAERQGWPLGAMPAKDDIAAIIAEIADVEEIDRIAIRLCEPQIPAVTRSHLVMLAPGAVRVRCRQAETEPA